MKIARILWLVLVGSVAVLAASPNHPCASCHPAQVSGYARTGMANSLFRPKVQPSGRFTHALSGSTFSIQATANGMRQRIERNGFEGEFPVEYVIGSGNHAFGYLVRAGDYLFQSPVSWYSEKKRWDMAPGYEGDRNPDFTRPVTPECLLCHSGKPLPCRKHSIDMNVRRSRRRQSRAIDVTARLRHTCKLRRPGIFSIRRSFRRGRGSVCEQCHLGGEARIPNPGRRISEFHVGQQLEDVFAVYVFDNPPEAGLKVVSHAEQLALSACARQSGDRMWCGTCHDPHQRPENTAVYYRAKCLGCHGADLVNTHPGPSEDCVGCHMQRQTARDGGHTAFTDHRIRRQPNPGGRSATSPRKLVAWHEPAPKVANRNLGLANITVGERDQSAAHMDAGFRLLSAVYEVAPKDPPVLTALGLVLLRKGRPIEAARMYEQALSLQPNYAPYHVNVATAWNEAGDSGKAISHLRKRI